MLNYLKQWYEENFTDPNQVSLALIVIFSVLITYILIQTISPILVAIVLNLLVVWIVLRLTTTFERALGDVGIAILKKVFGIILLAIAIKLFSSNIKELF